MFCHAISPSLALRSFNRCSRSFSVATFDSPSEVADRGLQKEEQSLE